MAINNNVVKIIYKLLNEILLLLLLAYGALLISDGLIPGFVTSHFSFLKITIAVFIALGATMYLGKTFNFLHADFDKRHSKMVFILIVLSFLLVGNALLKFSLPENLIITFTTSAIFYYFYKTVLGDN